MITLYNKHERLPRPIFDEDGCIYDRKYVMTTETMTFKFKGGTYQLYRIQLLANDIVTGKKRGDLGGWIESEDNLDQQNHCWVGDEAKCFGEGKVQDDDQITGNDIVT